MSSADAKRRLAQKRSTLEGALLDFRTAVSRDVGLEPKSRTWVLPLLAASVGLAIALALRKSRQRRLGGT